MKHFRKFCLNALIAVGVFPTVMPAQVSFLELDQRERIFNRLQEGAGLSGAGATPGQFSAYFSFAAVLPKTGDIPQDPPSGPGVGGFRLSHIRVGATLFGRASSFQFGQIIARPDTDENGDDLTVNASDYWEPRPFEEIDRLGYRWSEGTSKVVATVAGSYDITWRKNDPENSKPADFDANPDNYLLESGLYYVLYTHTHTADAGITINPPGVAEDGSTPVDAGYWLEQPPIFRDTERYHYSESANVVFATQPGPVAITWRRKEGQTTQPSAQEIDNFLEVGGLYYRLYLKMYIVSGSAVQPPKRIYWTYQGYPGIAVEIPEARVSDIKIVYNNDMPENVPVSEGFELLGGSGVGSEQPGGQQITSSITSTLWYSPSEKALKALNRQGRLFVEFLGAPDPATNIPAHLGIEIVDVVEQPVPGDEHVDIGERVPDRSSEEGEVLRGRVANQPEGEDFVFRHIRQVGGQDVGELEGVRFFARKETTNVNDIVMWWRQEGIEGILWPHSYIRYDFDWPVDTSKFSHYIRPLVANEEEAKETAVVLNGEEVPTIEYQDPLDQPRAFITGDFRFYSYLTPDYPSHRTLLRFLDGTEIKFERVFSWLGEALKDRPVEQHLTAAGIQPSLLYEAFDGDDGLNGLNGLHGILISGDLAYIAGHDEKSVSILDISDPSAPQELAIIRHGVSYGAGSWELDGAIGLALDGDYLFVAARLSDVVTIIDVSVPALPTFVARIKDEVDGFAKLNEAKSVSVQGNYLFVGSGTDDAVTVVDISTPSAPGLASEIEESVDTPGLNGIYQISAQGNYLYVSGQVSDSFAIYEISGNGELSFEGIALHGSEMFNDLDGPLHFALDGTIAYVAAKQSDAVPVIDVSDPENPKLLSVIENGQDGVTLLDDPFGIVVADSTLYVAAQAGNALMIFDVADPSNPKLLTDVKQGDLGTAGLGGPTFVAVDGSKIYVAGRGNDALTLFNTAPLLQDHLAAGDLGSSGNSVAIDLESYDSARDTFFWADTSIIPRIVEENVYVGEQ